MDKLEISALVGEQTIQKSASSLGGVSVSHKVVKVSKTNFAPKQDFEVPVQSTLAGLRYQNLALARISPTIAADLAEMKALLVLVDTSASRAAGFYQQVEQLGAGEIVLTCMDRDGTRDGYDLEMTRAVAESVKIPVVASGGAGKPEHLVQVVTEGGASAALAASIFHFGQYTIEETKQLMAAGGVPIRV